MLTTLYAIILLEGFASISIEMLTIRQLIPFFGNSVIITSLIIGIFLLFLAIGYWRGGQHKQNFLEKLASNFTISLVFTGIGFSYFFISAFVGYLMGDLHIPHLITLTVYLLLILAPTIYLLGQTVPLTTNLFNQQKGVAGISGQALFISTIGSFLGAVLTTLIIFNYFGVGFSVFFNCGLLFILIMAIYLQAKPSYILVACLCVVMGLVYLLNVQFEEMFFLKTNNYANYRITQSDGKVYAPGKILIVNNSYASLISEDQKSFPYVEFIKDLLFKKYKVTNQDILIIGAGGFTVSAENEYGNHFDYVDIDTEILPIAEENFLEDKAKGDFYGQDARLFLNNNEKKYNIVISDPYNSSANIPASLVTKEYFQKIYNTLTDNGILIANIIASPMFRDNYSRTIDNTIRSVFGNCTVVPITPENKVSNLMYICPKHKYTEGVYSDNLNSSALDYFYLF